jgi:rubrerythrin
MPVQDIEAQQVVNDLRGGAKDAEIMAKYNLSLQELTQLFERLISEGLVQESEIQMRASVAETQQMEVFKCQACGKVVFDQSEKCPDCQGELKKLSD